MRGIALAALILSGCAIASFPPEAVNGRVVTETGQPIEGATVILRMSYITPLAFGWSGLLQLTRTDADGRFRFAKGADQGFKFAVEARDYVVDAIHVNYYGSWASPKADLAEPLEIKLEPKHPKQADSGGCLELCVGSIDECRRAVQFHYGDKTRCDEWRRQLP
jgi:hypothetical protein